MVFFPEARLSPTQPRSRSPDGRTMTVAEVLNILKLRLYTLCRGDS